MPFYGRPSKSCQSCRERRIKCDLIEPVCSQCKRAGKQCGGYRDVPSFMFRDENDRTARRSAAAKSKSEARRRILDSEKSSSSPEHFESPQSTLVIVKKKLKPRAVLIPAIPAAVSSTIEDQGLDFFVHRFVTAISMLEQTPPHLEVPQLIWAMLLHPPVRDAAVSVGLAAKSNITRDRSMRLVAKEKYVAAISSVRLAVENPQQANPDQTFKLMLMLSLYEMVSCTAKQFDSWTVHLDGATALLKQLASEQTLNVFGPRRQLQYYYLSIVKYFIAEENTAPDLLEWSPDISSFGPEVQPAICLIDIMIRFMRVHYSMRSDPNIDPRTAIRLALSFESELNQWEKTLPEKWVFVIHESSDTQNTFNGKYIIYDDAWAPRDLIHYFWARLMVNEMILLHISRLAVTTFEDLEQRQLAFDTIARMGTCICAGAASQMSAYGRSAPSGNTKHMPPLNGVFMLMFPLAIAGGAGGSLDEVHEWVVQRLQMIGSTMGIRRALEMIPRLKRSREEKRQQIMIQ